MKKIIGAIALTFGSFASAQEEYASTWEVFGLYFEGSEVESLLLDVRLGPRFVAGNGIFVFVDGSSVATSGTCFVTTVDSVYCNLTLDYQSVAVEFDLFDLNGTGVVVDHDGFVIENGELDLVKIR